MSLGKKLNQAKKSTTGAMKSTVDKVKGGLTQAQKEVACIEAINNVRNNIQGHDPRTWMMACAKETLFKMQGPEYFKACLEAKVRMEVKDISDPEAYVETLWNMIKDSCPTC